MIIPRKYGELLTCFGLALLVGGVLCMIDADLLLVKGFFYGAGSMMIFAGATKLLVIYVDKKNALKV